MALSALVLFLALELEDNYFLSAAVGGYLTANQRTLQCITQRELV